MLRSDRLDELQKSKMTLIGYKLNPEFEHSLDLIAQQVDFTMHGICNLLINKGLVLHYTAQNKRDPQLAKTAQEIRQMMVQSTPEAYQTIRCRSQAEYHGSITLGIEGGKTNTIRLPDFIVKFIRYEASLHNMTNPEIIFSLLQAGFALLIKERTANKNQEHVKTLWNRKIENITFEKGGTGMKYNFEYIQFFREGKK